MLRFVLMGPVSHARNAEREILLQNKSLMYDHQYILYAVDRKSNQVLLPPRYVRLSVEHTRSCEEVVFRTSLLSVPLISKPFMMLRK